MNNLDKNLSKELILKYMKEWKWFVLSVGCCVALAVFYLKITAPVYQVNANVLIKEDDSKKGMGSSMMKNFSLGFGFPGSLDVEDELYVISSHSVLRKTVQDLGLNVSYEERKYGVKKIEHYQTSALKLTPAFSLDTLSAILSMETKVAKKGTVSVVIKKDDKKLGTYEFKELPADFSTPYGDFTLSATDRFKKDRSMNYLITVAGSDVVAEYLSSAVSIRLASKKANVINLSLKTKDIPKGKDILNKIISLYNQDAIQDKNIVAANTAAFIQDRLAIISKELADAETDVEVYKKDNNIFDLAIESKMLVEQNKDLQQQLLELETNINVIKLLQEYVTMEEHRYDLIPSSLGITEDGAIESIKEYNGLLLERIKLLQNSEPNNPTLLLLDSQIDATRKNVLLSIGNVKSSIEVTKRELQKQENLILGRYMQGPQIEREFWDIKRQQVMKEQLFLFLIEKREENALKLAVTAPKAKVIDEAFNMNEPLSPNRKMILLIGLVMGVALPVGVIYLKDLFRVHFESKTELEELTDLPVIGEICENKGGERIVVKDGDTTSIVELFRLIRTNMQFVLNRRSDKVILVTSTESGEGKSFFSINFALSLSLLKKKVVLVGLDIRNPRLVDYMDIHDSTVGVTNFLSSEDMKPEDIPLHSTLYKNFDVITAGPIPPNPAELLLSERLDEMFAYLRERYDYIVIDSAPVGMVADSFSLDRVSDATIYICRANYSKRENIRFAESIVKNSRLKKVSLVINGTQTKTGYGYGYGKVQKKA